MFNFEQELNIQLNSLAKLKGFLIDQLKNEIAYERFLARMNYKQVTIKGGYAVRSQLESSPYTRDIDMIILEKEISDNSAKQIYAIRDWVNEQLYRNQIDDNFRFDLGEPLSFIDLKPHEAAVRISVRTYINNSSERFTTFPIDIAIVNNNILPPNIITISNSLNLINTNSFKISVVPPEQLFADKLLIYLRSYNQNRVGDIVHMTLLSERKLDIKKIIFVLNELVIKGTEPIDQILKPLIKPPDSWFKIFAKIMPKEKDIDLDQAFEIINNIYKQILESELPVL